MSAEDAEQLIVHGRWARTRVTRREMGVMIVVIFTGDYVRPAEPCKSLLAFPGRRGLRGEGVWHARCECVNLCDKRGEQWLAKYRPADLLATTTCNIPRRRFFSGACEEEGQ